MNWKQELENNKMFTAISTKTGITYKVLEIEDTIKFIEENFTLKVSRVDAEVKVQKCEQKFEDFREFILQKEREGKIIISTFEGIGEADLDEIIKQPTEGLLYDLNRNRETILTYIYDQKWVNDFACMKVIEKLKALLSA